MNKPYRIAFLLTVALLFPLGCEPQTENTQPRTRSTLAPTDREGATTVEHSDTVAADSGETGGASASPAANHTATEDTDAPVTIREQNTEADGTVVAELSNGMTVIARRVSTAPVICVRGYVRAGGIYEGRWLGCGLSHLCEHLVAKESLHQHEGMNVTTSSPHEKRARTAEIGGQSNAYTSSDHTCYYISAHSSKAMDCIELIVDQLSRPTITHADFEREHGVVQRELEMGKDDPMRVLYYAHQANLYRDHPAGVPVIGFAEPLAKVTYDDVMRYVDKMYVPQSMVLSIVGDVDPQEAIDRAVRRLAGFEAGRTPVLTIPEVPPVTGVRRRTMPSKAYQEAAEMLSFQSIDLFEDDLYPLDVLATILGTGQSSRLVREVLFEQGLVTSISCWSATPNWGKGAFTINFRCPPGKADEAEQAVLDQLRKIAEEGVTENELARAKRLMKADYVRSQQTVEDIAGSLGRDLLTTGDPFFHKNYTDRIQDVSRFEVQEVAQKYFDFDDMVVTRVVPEAYFRRRETDADESAAVQGPKVFKLANGLTVVLQPSDAVDLTAMVLATKGGLLLETPETNGLGNLMAALSTKGAGEMDAKEIAEFFNYAGGGIGVICGDNSFLYRASVLSDEFPGALDIFADVVLEPTFPADELETLRPLARSAVMRIEEDWGSQLMKFFRGRYFVGSPWRMVSKGDVEIIDEATRERIVAWHDKAIKAGDSVLAVYGNFDPESTREHIVERFGKMPAGETDLPEVPERRLGSPDEPEIYVMRTSTQQAGIIVASPAPRITDVHDRLALMLLDTIISGYHLPSGWLHTELRGKQLVYVVHAFHKAGFIPGAFITYAGTQPPKAPEVVDIILANLRKARTYTPAQEELDRAINTIVTAEVLESQSLSDLATNAALNELYGLGVDWPRTMRQRLEAVTPQGVREVAERYLGQGLVITVTTPQPERFPQAEVFEPEDYTSPQPAEGDIPTQTNKPKEDP